MTTKSSILPHWSEFWQEGHPTTFGPTMPENYQGLIADFWRQQFQSLPPKARVLDMAAGNGAVAILAVQTSREKDLELQVSASDLATIAADISGSDELRAHRRQVKFFSGAANEKLPFKDGQFQMVSSQFGLEYGKLARGLQEVRRVLKPGGRFAALVHHSDSLLLQAARSEHAAYRTVLEELNLFGRVRAYFSAMGNPRHEGELRQALARAKPLATSVNEAVAEIRKRHPQSDCARQMVAVVQELAKGAARVELKQRLRAVTRVAHDFQMAADRLGDMVAAGLGPDELDDFVALVRQSAFAQVNVEPFIADDGKLGAWKVVLG